MEYSLNSLVIVDKLGQPCTVGEGTVEGLRKLGVLTECRHKPFVYHASLTHDAIEALLEELDLLECGFCRDGKPTHQVALNPSKLTYQGQPAVATRPLMLCADCALLFQTGDRELLRERLVETTVEINKRRNRRDFDAGGGAEALAERLRPEVQRITDETFDATVGQPYELPPPVESSGIVIIGGE